MKDKEDLDKPMKEDHPQWLGLAQKEITTITHQEIIQTTPIRHLVVLIMAHLETRMNTILQEVTQPIHHHPHLQVETTRERLEVEVEDKTLS